SSIIMKIESSVIISLLLLMVYSQTIIAAVSDKGIKFKYFATGLCETPGYKCVKVNKGDTWEKLFPDENQRDIVQRINRTNMGLYRFKMIAIPENLENATIQQVAPFPKQIEPSDNK